ncbi:MAG: polyphenol oxidase family protein [bacterium]
MWVKTGALFQDTNFNKSSCLTQFTTNRSQGNFKDDALRRRFMAGFPWEGWAIGEQVHGTNIVIISKPYQGERLSLKTDGFITGCRSVAVGIFTADCVPVFFNHTYKNIVGIAHAGWKGVYNGIVPHMIDLLTSTCACDTASIQVSIGPHMRSCCYEAGKDLADIFKLSKHTKLDLEKIVIQQLTDKGIQIKNISSAPWCTAHETDQFYSFRKENGTENRMFSVIGMV